MTKQEIEQYKSSPVDDVHDLAGECLRLRENLEVAIDGLREIAAQGNESAEYFLKIAGSVD